MTPMRTEWLRRSIEACNGGVRSHRPTGDLSFYLNALFLRVRHSPSVGSADSSLPEGAEGRPGIWETGDGFLSAEDREPSSVSWLPCKTSRPLEGGFVWADVGIRPYGRLCRGCLAKQQTGDGSVSAVRHKTVPCLRPQRLPAGGIVRVLGLAVGADIIRPHAGRFKRAANSRPYGGFILLAERSISVSAAFSLSRLRRQFPPRGSRGAGK